MSFVLQQAVLLQGLLVTLVLVSVCMKLSASLKPFYLASSTANSAFPGQVGFRLVRVSLTLGSGPSSWMPGVWPRSPARQENVFAHCGRDALSSSVVCAQLSKWLCEMLRTSL